MKSSLSRSRFGSATPFILMGVVAVTLVGVAGYYVLTSTEESNLVEPITETVVEGEFVSQVLDQGEVQSSENVEIRCEARARNGTLNVLTVVPEGSLVKAGDFLVQLDSTGFEKELEQQQVAKVNAETRVIQAESTLESARATLDEYINGTFEEEKLRIANEIADADAAIATAEQKMVQANETLGYSNKLQAKGYITKQSLQTAQFELDRAEIDLLKGQNSKKLALKKLEVLENITLKKNTVQFEADIKAADVKLDSERQALEVEKEKLAEIEEMIAKCRITVPEGVQGQVVYAKESSRGGNDWVLEEGTTVRQNQVLIRLPNPDKMEVKALINEQSITQIKNNMPCTIKVDALNNVTLQGFVTKVNQYAESSGWMSSSVRKYAVNVKILDPPEALKPGMNASVTIQVQYEPNVLLAPIQTVYASQDAKYVLKKDGDNWVTQEVEVGGDNSQMVFIKAGVKEGDVLAMNPGAYKDDGLLIVPESELETKIELPEGVEKVAESDQSENKAGELTGGPGRPGGQGRPGGAGPDGPRGQGGGGGGGFNPSAIVDRMFERDQDGDGKLSKEEAGDRMAPMFGRADSDGDGLLTREEVTKAFSSFSGGGGGRSGGGGGGFGGGGRQK